MNTYQFNRGIDDDLINVLSEEAWWRKIVEDEGLFIGIRNNYLNVYSHGGSIIRAKYLKRNKELKGKITSAYLASSKGKAKEEYSGNELRNIFDKQLSDIIKNAKEKAGPEKAGIQKIISKHPQNIIDLEVAFSGGKGSKSFPRIDIAAIFSKDNCPELHFIEVKRTEDQRLYFTHKSNQTDPEVIGQIKEYKDFLADDDAIASLQKCYIKICDNLLKIYEKSPNERVSKAIPIWQDIVSKNKLSINRTVKLVVFGNEYECKKTIDGKVEKKTWSEQKSKLQQELSDDLIYSDFPEKINLELCLCPR